MQLKIMVSPVRIRVPPLTKYLQMPIKWKSLGWPHRLYVNSASTARLGEDAVRYFVEIAMKGGLDRCGIPQIFAEQHVHGDANL